MKDIDVRLAALEDTMESRVGSLRKKVRKVTVVAAEARILATTADRDVSEFHAKLDFQKKLIDANHDDVKELLGRMETVRKDQVRLAADNQTTVAALRDDMDGMRTDLDGVRGDVDNLSVDFDGLRGEIGGLRGDVDSLRTDVISTCGDIATMHTELGGMRTDVGDMRTDFGVMRSDLGDVRTDLGDVRTDLDSIRRDVTDHRDRTETVAAEVIDIRTQL